MRESPLRVPPNVHKTLNHVIDFNFFCAGDVCFEPVQKGPCEPGVERWHFNPERNACELLQAGQCGAAHNAFPDKHMCNKVCPGECPVDQSEAVRWEYSSVPPCLNGPFAQC